MLDQTHLVRQTHVCSTLFEASRQALSSKVAFTTVANIHMCTNIVQFPEVVYNVYPASEMQLSCSSVFVLASMLHTVQVK